MENAETLLKGGISPTTSGVEALAIGEGKTAAPEREEEVLTDFGREVCTCDLTGLPVFPGLIGFHTHLADRAFTVDILEVPERSDRTGDPHRPCRFGTRSTSGASRYIRRSSEDGARRRGLVYKKEDS